jgi:hypothetical protein
MPLNEAQVKSARPAAKAYKLADGSGMFLYVTPQGGKLCRLNYRFEGKEKLLALGGVSGGELKQARERRDAARALLKDDKAPASERKREKRNARLEAENAFEVVVRDSCSSRRPAGHPNTRLAFFAGWSAIFSQISGRARSQPYRPLDLLDVIRKLERRGATDLSHRMLQQCGQVFRFAVVTV